MNNFEAAIADLSTRYGEDFPAKGGAWASTLRQGVHRPSAKVTCLKRILHVEVESARSVHT